ncbi:MAG: 4Fe-4S dicluster domain-containing protein, partial [Phycisphaerales bacterium]
AEERPVYVKMNCMHCNDPACVSACLVGAMRKEPNGAVSYDAWKCMGCRYCMVVCPFEMPTYEYDDVWTPQVRKCTLCSDDD